MTSSVFGLRRSSKACPKTKLAPKKVTITGGRLPVWSTKPSESWRNHYIWEVETCAQQMDEMYWKLQHLQPVLGQQKGPNSSSWQRLTAGHTTNASKGEWIGLRSSASSVIWPLTNQLPLQPSQQLVTGKILPQPAGSRKCFPRVHWILKLRFLCYKLTNLFLIGNNVLNYCNGFYFDNKDVFESRQSETAITFSPT